MISFIQNNAIALLIGFILGCVVASFVVLGNHNLSKASQIKAYERVLDEKNILLKQCIEKPSNAIKNEFSPEIGKNKKGTILINTVPDINNEMSLPETNSEVFIQEGMQQPSSKDLEAEKSETKTKRGKGNMF